MATLALVVYLILLFIAVFSWFGALFGAIFFIAALIWGVIWGGIGLKIHEDNWVFVFGFIFGPIGILIACGFCLKDISISLKKMANTSNNSGEQVKTFGKRIKIKPLKF